MTSITLTFSEDSLSASYTLEDLQNIYDLFPDNSQLYALHYNTEHLNITVPEAWLLIIKNPFNNSDSIYSEIYNSTYCTVQEKKSSNKKLAPKKARKTLFFSDYGSEIFSTEYGINVRNFPSLVSLYSQIYAFSSFSHSSEYISTIEANYYPNIHRTNIRNSFTLPRPKNITYCLGETIPLTFQWFCRGIAITPKVTFELESGDIYVMSEKTMGCNSKKLSDTSLRHYVGLAN